MRARDDIFVLKLELVMNHRFHLTFDVWFVERLKMD